METKNPDSHVFSSWYMKAMQKLLQVVQKLSVVRTLDEVTQIVRIAARDLTKTDGATFVLREGDQCYYADEYALSPLWKGQRFPMKACVSGWVMLNKKSVIIEDIYDDPRVPTEAYRPTFVKSIAMVPIRKENPIGAIGNYWAETHRATQEEVLILEALANFTSISIENVKLNLLLEKKIQMLEISNSDLRHFAWAASHDLRTPLRTITTLSHWLEEEIEGALNPKCQEYLSTMRKRVDRTEKLLDDLLTYTQVEKRLEKKKPELIRCDQLLEEVLSMLEVPKEFTIEIDPKIKSLLIPRIPLQYVLPYLISNSIIHHDKEKGLIKIEIYDAERNYIIHILDDGPGIPFEYKDLIFEMFQTLKPRDKLETSGVGLAITRKILSSFGGSIELDLTERQGACFKVIIPKILSLEVEDVSESNTANSLD